MVVYVKNVELSLYIERHERKRRAWENGIRSSQLDE